MGGRVLNSQEWVAKILREYWPLFLSGSGVTLIIALSGTTIGFLIGLGIGVVRTIPVNENTIFIKRFFIRLINIILSVYIEVFRGTPMIVQSMVIYYGSMIVLGIRNINNILAGIFIVSINTGAYLAEIVRGGILSIDKGQFEAAHSLGMTHWQTMLCIVLPQAVRNILPAIGNELIINIKDTSVLNVIAVSELYFQAKSAAGTYYRYFEAFFIAAAIYLVMTLTCSRLLRLVEKRLDGPSSFTIYGSHSMPEVEFRVNRGEGGKKGK